MRIAYLRQGGGVFLDPKFKGSYAGGWEDRYAFFRGAQQRGHEIVIYTPINKQDLHLLKRYPHITYDPTAKRIAPGTDVVFIENGPDNYNYGESGRLLPNVPLMHYLLKYYKGLVFYHFKELRPALIPEAYSINVAYKYLFAATAVDLFKDKGWVILTQARNTDYWLSESDLPRSPFGTLRLPFEHFSLGCFLEERRRLPDRDWVTTLMYSGNERGRKSQLAKYYGCMPDDIDVALYGKWSGEEEIEELGIRFMGSIPNADLSLVWSFCLAQIYITNTRFSRAGILASRIYQAIGAGCTMWAPNEHRHLFPESWDDFYCFEKPEDMVSILRGLQKLSWADRVALNEDQLRMIAAYTPESRMIEFEFLVRKYYNLPKVQFDKVLPEVRRHLRDVVFVDSVDDTVKGQQMKADRRRVLKGKYDMENCKIRKPVHVGMNSECSRYTWFD